MIRRLIFALALLPSLALGQSLPAPAMRGDNITTTAPGGTAARSLAARAGDTYNVGDYGAKCDGTTDDSTAINAAIQAIRGNTQVSGGFAWPIAHVGRLTFPKNGAGCVIRSTIDATKLYGSGFTMDGYGSAIICKTNGTPCIDATVTGQAGFIGLNILGSCTAGEVPNLGFVLARRTESLNLGADHNYLERPTITGCFTKAAYYNRSSETTMVTHAWFANQQDNAYGAIFDGGNVFNFQSAFTPGFTYPVNTPSSFAENTCIQCIVQTFGNGSYPLWIGGTERHKWINSYALATGATPGPAVTLSFANGAINHMLDLDIHFEGQALNSLVQFTGAANPVIQGFRLTDPAPQHSAAAFKRDTGVSAVTLEGAEIRLGRLSGGASWWDSAAAYTVGGTVYNHDGAYTAPGNFTGTYCVGATCNVTYALPSNLTAGSISNPGGVGSLTLVSKGSYQAGSSKPTCAIGAPASGGQQATCHVTGLTIFGFGTIGSGGSGYTVNDILSFSGGTCSSPPQIKVTAVSGGVITGFQFWSGGLCDVTPTAPTSMTGGTGTGATITGTAYLLNSSSFLVVDSAGSGYTSIPAVTIGNGGSGSSVVATAQASLNSQITVAAGNGQVFLDGTGTKLGVSGSGGFPVLTVGALIDNSGVRQSLGSSYTVPQNTSLVRFIQTGTVASSTVTLPTALADGQPVQFVNYAGAITALTFSPAVNGWTNGSTLAANSGLRVRWDATASAWYREQ